MKLDSSRDVIEVIDQLSRSNALKVHSSYKYQTTSNKYHT